MSPSTAGRSSRPCPERPGSRRPLPAGRPGLPAKGDANDPAGSGDRPQRVCGLPRLRDELQTVEHLGHGGCADRPESLWG
ncbi:MAG: hypothetical protein Q8L16_18430 [Hydrogenophaga sp.]|nr:hypothetical protein [Hydrogenophaga sp.]